MSEPAPAKPKLHKSQIGMFDRCPKQYEFRYVEGLVLPPAAAMLAGTGVHAAAAKDLTAKRDTGKLLPLADIQAAAAEVVNAEWDKTGVLLDEEDMGTGEAKVRGNTVDMAVTLAGLHHTELAPTLNPMHIERPFTVELKGFPVDLSGTLDLQEATGCLRDLKTRKASPPEGLADASMELTFYGLAARALDGTSPTDFALDCLVKTKTPKLVTQHSRRHDGAYRALLLRIKAVSRAIESGAFPPCSADSWACSRKFCGYFDRCPYGKAARVIG